MFSEKLTRSYREFLYTWDSIILSRAIREGLVEKVTFEQRLKKCGSEPLQ